MANVARGRLAPPNFAGQDGLFFIIVAGEPPFAMLVKKIWKHKYGKKMTEYFTEEEIQTTNSMIALRVDGWTTITVAGITSWINGPKNRDGTEVRLSPPDYHISVRSMLRAIYKIAIIPNVYVLSLLNKSGEWECELNINDVFIDRYTGELHLSLYLVADRYLNYPKSGLKDPDPLRIQ